MDSGSTYKRCACTGADGRRLGRGCTKLRRASHGQWYFQLRLPDGRQRRRGGFLSQSEAAEALRAEQQRLAALPRPGGESAGNRPTALTTGQWLEHWLAEKERTGSLSEAGKKIAATTARGYRGHIARYLRPALGDVPLSELSRQHIAGLFRAIDDGTLSGGKQLSAASVRRIYATLRSAMNAAVKHEHLTANPALLVNIAAASRPKALVWTDERVAQWRRTGLRPSPVMVWTPEQTGQFLDSSEDDPLSALFHVIALRGLRRGEAVGMTWSDLDLHGGTLLIHSQVVQLGWQTLRTSPKAGSERLIALDEGTVAALRAHRDRQRELCQFLNLDPAAITDVFLQPDGQPVHPDYVTRHFARLIAAAALPPIRVHDLRHGAATLALASGVELKVVQETLGHSSIAITADTYTSVLPQVARAAAQSAADLIPRRNSQPVQPIPPSPEPNDADGASDRPPASDDNGAGVAVDRDIV